MPGPREERAGDDTVRVSLRSGDGEKNPSGDETANSDEDDGSDSVREEEDADEEVFVPEFRLVRKDDPEAYGFSTPQYSAHKLPRDVVDASRGGESGLREFAEQWKEVQARRQRQEEGEESEDDA